MTEPPSRAHLPNWPLIVAEIAAAYLEKEKRPLSSYKLGLMIGRPHQTIDLIVAGSEPKHSDAVALLALLVKFTEKIT